ncbi:MAG: Txe/YoeB family addiction module toxin [Bacteroidetes bacterium]|nr:Txe/YoeB family addiction module toxin [Bacteroidota bacterium]
MRNVSFTAIAMQQFQELMQSEPRLAQKAWSLIAECARNPFEGTGKPEPLKHELRGKWSRRINEKHRLVYMATETEIIIYACKQHYTSL